MAAFSAAGRDRSVVPSTVARLAISAARSSSPVRPRCSPITASRPPVARASTLRSRWAPPTTSRTTSTPRPLVSSRTRARKSSERWSTTTSAPSSAQRRARSGPPAVAITRAPRAAAIWIAVVPMPPEPPCTSRVSPARRRAAATIVDHTVQTASGRAAARLRAGETLLVHGGSGGIGTTAIQMAAALGARVIATAGGPERARRCAELGADVVVDHRSEDFLARVREETRGRGVDVVLDVVGGAHLERNVEALATGGRLAVIGLQRGRTGELDLAALMAKRATGLGPTLRSRPAAEKAAIVADVVANVWPMVADGRLRPVIQQRLPLADGARAHELLEAGRVFGKLLLIP